MMEKRGAGPALAAPQWLALFRRYNQSGRGTWTRCQEVSATLDMHTGARTRTLDRMGGGLGYSEFCSFCLRGNVVFF